jgi:diguanylate cyclase (GGDEF)-like protein/PAS domain S-box-containing protein
LPTDLQNLLDLIPLPVWVFDETSLDFIAVNQAAVELYGYTKAAFLELNLADLRLDQDRMEVVRMFAAPLADRFHGVFRHKRRNGTTIDVSIESVRIHLEGLRARLSVAIDVSEVASAKRAHARVASSLEHTLSSITDGFYALSPDLTVTAVNEKGAAAFNRAPRDVVGRPLFELEPEARDSPFAHAFERVLHHNSSQHLEAYYPPHDRWYVVHALPSEGGIAVYFSDVTANHRAIAALQLSNERFRLAAEATNDVIWERDVLAESRWISTALDRVFGLSSRDFMADYGAWAAHVHEDDLARVLESVDQALASDVASWSQEYRLKRGDGRYAEVLERAMIVRDGGQAVRLVGALSDISQPREHERALLSYKSIVNAAPSGIVLVDAKQPDMPILFVNPAFETITGYQAAEVIGRNCRFLQGTDRDQEGLATLRKAFEAGRGEVVTLRNYRKDGRLFWNHLITTPVFGADGEVSQVVGILSDVTAERRSAEALAYHSTHDSLTGLLNRGLIEDRLTQALLQAHHHNQLITVMSISLDGFRAINDSAGFAAGDEVLQHVATTLKQMTGPGDSIARMIADEFLCVCLNLGDRTSVEKLARNILQQIARPIEIDGRTVNIQASMGVAVSMGAELDAAELQRRASAALLDAKAVARGSFRMHDPSMDFRIADRLALAANLREALDLGRFELHYQLQTDCETGRIYGAEALLRLRRDDGSLAAPYEFMSVAETTGLIVPIGHWVLTEACRQAMQWRHQGLEEMTMSVNVSIAQFRRAGFVEEVADVLAQSQMPPGCLELEITETLAMDGVENFIETVSRLKQLGLRIALDDFGTGFSSLTYLRRFGIDTLKIDRSFVRDITTDAKDAAICRTIIAMAHNLGMTAIAEGVETQAQASYLSRSGCDRLQGYFLHRPSEPLSVESRIRSDEPFFFAAPDRQEDIRTVMVLDDDELVGLALARIVERAGFNPVVVHNTPDAFETLALRRIDVVIADERMPDMRGSDFLLAVKDLYPDSVRILQSGHLDANVIAGALNRAGIFRYISKDSTESQVAQALRAAFESVRRESRS